MVTTPWLDRRVLCRLSAINYYKHRIQFFPSVALSYIIPQIYFCLRLVPVAMSKGQNITTPVLVILSTTKITFQSKRTERTKQNRASTTISSGVGDSVRMQRLAGHVLKNRK